MSEGESFFPPPEILPEPGIVVIGRFQPLHLGHTELIRKANDFRCSKFPHLSLIVAIGSANKIQSIQDPWSADERSEMIRSWLEENSISAEITIIPDIDDPPNWVSHAEKYHGKSGILVTSDEKLAELYHKSNWQSTKVALTNRDSLQGWRIRATLQMISTIDDENAIHSILKSSIPESVINYLISNDLIRRLATLGGGGEPVG